MEVFESKDATTPSPTVTTIIITTTTTTTTTTAPRDVMALLESKDTILVALHDIRSLFSVLHAHVDEEKKAHKKAGPKSKMKTSAW
jgi:hypothetical protein